MIKIKTRDQGPSQKPRKRPKQKNIKKDKN